MPSSRAVSALAVAACLALAACTAPTDGQVSATGPEVAATSGSPTGYEVTFRLDAPDAERVWLAGDLYFTAPELVSLAGAERSWLGDGWSAGDVSSLPLAADMAEMTRGDDGVWELTTAVPAGLWNYGFVTQECSLILLCTVAADPANPAPLPADADATQAWSQLFVALDPDRPTYDAGWQLPAAEQDRGTVEAREYSSDLAADAGGTRALGVYLPPGWDPARAEPYPLLVLSHGAGDDETAWWTQGGAAQQLDHAIAEGAIPPVIAITTDFSGLSEAGMEDPGFFELYATDLVDHVLPYAAAELHASADPAARAFAGLSMGGRLSEHLLLTRPDLFGAYGMWSMPAAVAHTDAAALTAAQLDAAATARIVHLGTGAQDALTPSPAEFAALAARYREAGLEAVTLDTNGGHAWWVWRLMLADFLATAAFAR